MEPDCERLESFGLSLLGQQGQETSVISSSEVTTDLGVRRVLCFV